jgi:hypothetical protein
MKIYHGSEKVIENPQCSFGNIHNDYGQGFYCTESEALAKEWACQQNKDGYANCYELNADDLKVLNLSDLKYNILYWLTILMQNRIFVPRSVIGSQNLDFLTKNYLLPYKNYDLIYGYRANDSYFSYAADFLENALPLQSLANAMKLGSLGLQVVLISKKSFKNLQYVESIKASKEKYYPLYKARDTKARDLYFNEQRKFQPKESIFLIDIIRKPELLNEIHI